MAHRNINGYRVAESHQKSKLTTAQVWEMRRLHEGGMGYGSLAYLFNCGVSTARDICKYRTRGMG